MPPQEQIPIAAKSLKSLEAYVGQAVILAPYRKESIVIINSYSGEQQLWVRPDFLDYRRAWEQAFGTVPAEHDVDHIYAKERAKQYGYAYVRLALVHRSVNRGNGAGVEKLMLKVPLPEKGTLPEIRYADYFQQSKLNHISLIPSKKYQQRQLPNKAILGRVPRKLKCSSVHIHRTGSSARVVTQQRSYAWSASVLEWVMGAWVGWANQKRIDEKLDQLRPGLEQAIPSGGGALVAVVFQQPDNASQYGFSTALFMYLYVMDYGSTAQEAYQKYQERLAQPGYATLSPGTYENWSKVESHLWISEGDL